MKSYPVTNEVRWRHRFSILAVVTAAVLVSWGAFVTSINAGLAVPDWPSSFNSYDPLNPWPEWWTIVPVLAEHGHRLMGMLIGLFTMTLAGWTVLKDERKWMKWLAVGALVLVILQGVLGGLRVVLVSVDLAMVHACVAQVFFSLLVALALFTSPGWLQARDIAPDTDKAGTLRGLTVISTLAVYVQIMLGVLLRHPGAGISPVLAGVHITGAVTVTTLLLATGYFIHRNFRGQRLLLRANRVQLSILTLQFALGWTAYLLLLDERGMIVPSNLQVIVNSSHVLIGAALLASTVALTLLALRRPTPVGGDALPSEPVLAAESLLAAGGTSNG
ncbi:MAG TPA: COX15/CtaA family protein [Rhodothermales bacterium]|nr:COX15/CtaA family protein [Rhodothermales bacterium]